MKPRPRHDFPVTVSAEDQEHPSHLAAYYRQMFDVQLNFSESISIVPRFIRDPWPPHASDQAIESEEEARRSIVAAARYTVTPDDTRATQVETFTSEEGRDHVVFYITSAEHAALVSELERLATESPSIYLGTPVSELGAPVLQRVLLNQILPSGTLSTHVMALLGRDQTGKVQPEALE